MSLSPVARAADAAEFQVISLRTAVRGAVREVVRYVSITEGGTAWLTTIERLWREPSTPAGAARVAPSVGENAHHVSRGAPGGLQADEALLGRTEQGPSAGQVVFPPHTER
jgi:hypothetical protein